MSVPSPDQSRGASYPWLLPGQAASLSHNEVLALSVKAARGAGMAWGLAEEAGFAALWLTRHGLDGPHHLLAHLADAQGHDWSARGPAVAVGHWTARSSRALCPIALGAALCDHAGLPEGCDGLAPVRIGRVDHPVLLVPFLATIARASRRVLDLTWDGGSLCIGHAPDRFLAAVQALDGPRDSLLIAARTGQVLGPVFAGPPSTAAATIDALNALAMRTTVPASDVSRAGAGAASSDND